MVVKVDARGCSCPQPVLMVKKAMGEEHSEIEVLVDNNTAKGNVTRFAVKQKHEVVTEETTDGYKLILKK